MRKTFYLALLAFCLSVSLPAQTLKERRVYYLDCSGSMVHLKLWDPVRANLIEAIESVTDQTTELMVVPFAFDMQYHNDLKPFTANATPEGKKALQAHINGLPKPSPNTMTYLSDPLKDFYTKRVTPDKVNYMFILTDGKTQCKQFPSLLQQWGGKYRNKNVYGFLVLLDAAAVDPQITNIVKGQPQLWQVQTAAVNINLVRLKAKAVFNAKNETYFDLPIYGKAAGKTFKAQFTDGGPYHVSKIETQSDKLRVHVTHKGSTSALPVHHNGNLHLTMQGGGPFDILVTEDVCVACEFKPERTLKISVR
ncbi:MAG: VWA domain-containing protein [Alloprevotella sp.]|nr:VWA domain-containing protein [Alloprevotella sp.]